MRNFPLRRRRIPPASLEPPHRNDGLRELEVHVNWSARRNGRRLGRSEVGALLAAATRCGPTGVMLHHALVDREGRTDLEQLLALLSVHDNARCVPLRSLV